MTEPDDTDDPGPPDDQSRVGRRPATTHVDLEEIAFDLFATTGFDQTSVDDIAAAAGIARRTFFRYYPSKSDLVWGDFAAQLERMQASLATASADLPVMEAIHQAVIEYHRLPVGHLEGYRRRLELIFGVPTLLANSTLRFIQWRQVVAEFAGQRLGVRAQDLLPQVIGDSALGAAMAAAEAWLRAADADLVDLVDQALGELAVGFRHRGG